MVPPLQSEPVIRLDHGVRRPLQRQLVEQLRAAIIDGRLPPGSRLPSTRALAIDCPISRNLVVAAYEELFAEGYVQGIHGSGTYVRRDIPAVRLERRTRPPADPVAAPAGSTGASLLDFRIDIGSVEPLPLPIWKRIWRGAAALPPPNRYLDVEGEPSLRAAIAGYLRRARGVQCGPEEVIVTSGSQHALELVARATVGQGRRAAVEEPGYHRARRALQQSGAELVPVPVDGDGLRIDLLDSGPGAPALVYVTPSHQFPLGCRLSVSRRLALLEWADANGALVVEDDYDSEFRYGSPPLPALAALDHSGLVAYVGTFSKILSPALRLGYLVAPPETARRVCVLRASSDWHSSWPLQRGLAGFVAGGEFDRHVRRMRRRYAHKRAALAEVLAAAPELGTLEGLEAGLHAFWRLDPGVQAVEVARTARERRVLVSPLHEFYCEGGVANGLGIGYGAVEVEDLVRGAELLVEAARRVLR